ncbi:MAG: Ig-like domain-containing protein [Candidatus Binataceae bacterium]
MVTNADPANGVAICQADNGGCPSGLRYGGTSVAAPEWAAFAAILNQAEGKNLGFVNPLLYQLADSDAFHNAASMNSDFAHVGLGSPNLDAMQLLLANQSAGAVDASISEVDIGDSDTPEPPSGFPADGTAKVNVVVILRDSNGNTVSGKTVTLTATSGTDEVITPSSGVTNAANGAVIFKVSDTAAEALTLVATDSTDGVQLDQKPNLPFFTPPAAAVSLVAGPSQVTADGVTPATITVTLEDSLNRPTPGKLVTLAQTGNSVIGAPNPPVTDSNGQIAFTAVDTNDESVTYTATDVTDDYLPVPQAGTVTFSNSVASGCAAGNPVAAPGFVVAPFATGFAARSFSYDGINLVCSGALAPAFDASGNAYVSDVSDGNIYKFPPGGGVAGPTTLLTTTPIGPTLGQPVFDNGNLYVTRLVTSPTNLNSGVILQIDPSTGAVMKTVMTGLTCPAFLAVDPLTGDLFTADNCFGQSAGTELWRISNPGGANPTLSVYATLPGVQNGGISFTPGGTIYLAGGAVSGNGFVAQVSGTNVSPTTVITLSGVIPSSQGLLAEGSQANEGAQFLVLSQAGGSSPLGQTMTEDLTVNPPAQASILSNSAISNSTLVTGPDGCLYGGLNKCGVQGDRCGRQMSIYFGQRAGDLDARPADRLAQSGARLGAELHRQFPLRNRARRHPGSAQRERRQPANSASQHRRRRRPLQLHGRASGGRHHLRLGDGWQYGGGVQSGGGDLGRRDRRDLPYAQPEPDHWHDQSPGHAGGESHQRVGEPGRADSESAGKLHAGQRGLLEHHRRQRQRKLSGDAGRQRHRHTQCELRRGFAVQCVERLEELQRAHADAIAESDADSHGNAHSDPNSYAHPDSDAYSDSYGDADADRTGASADSAARAAVRRTERRPHVVAGVRNQSQPLRREF